MAGHWVALKFSPPSGAFSPPEQCPLVQWLWTLTPRVACLQGVVLADVSMSLRLFGGEGALQRRVRAWAREQSVLLAWAPTGLAAQALLSQASHSTIPKAFGPRWWEVLDSLPLSALPSLEACMPDLHAMGCQTLGQFRRLPRVLLVPRVGAAPLGLLDQAYGLQPEAYQWLAPAEHFERSLDCPEGATTVEQLLAFAIPLLQALQEWLAARQQGATALELRWRYEHRARDERDMPGQVWVRSAHPMHRVTDFSALLTAHLAQQALRAPVNRLTLRLETWVPAVAHSHSWLPDPARQQMAVDQMLERIQARLGPDAVRVLVPHSDHRPERMQTWQPGLPARARPNKPVAPSPPPGLVPAWLLPEPLALAVRAHRPVYRGPLQLLLGPDRVEVGWWEQAQGSAAPRERRDYWLAYSPAAGLLWVFQRRMGHAPPQWFLHGFFG
ncbi:DNA polymerase Y family protein [Acidovorax lacteus]|uniref:DNA polymerase Y family protein n=1 Tax=Acidovorax lacteus TaxID=1924988 RepID=A0ABP8KZW2_9BURK